MAANNGIVCLIVGGKFLQTTSETLCKDPDSFLARFCEVDDLQPSVRDDSGAFFIDCDPRYFRVTLNYLRSNVVDLEGNVSLDALLAEADLYCLSGLIKRLEGMRGNYRSKTYSSSAKTVWVTTHKGTGKPLREPTSKHTHYATSITTFVNHADALTRIASTEHCKNCKLDKLDVCDILGECGFLLRFTKEKTEDDMEFFFSSV